MPAPGREAASWLSALGGVWGKREERLVGLMVVREGERRKEGVVGGERPWRTERARKAAVGRGDALRRPAGWGGGWAGRGDGQCPVGLAAGGLGLSTAPLLLPWDSDQASPRPHGSQPRPGVAGRGLQGFLWIL